MKSMFMDSGERKLYELSQAQKRIIYVQVQYPKSCMYNIGGVSIFTGEVNKENLLESIKSCIEKNSAFGIRISKIGDEYYQYFSGNDKDYEIEEIALDNVQDFDSNLQQWEKSIYRIPFELLEHPLYKFYIFQSPKGCGYIVKLHHIIADGWSMQLIVKLIVKEYSRLSSGIKEEERIRLGSYLTFLQNDQIYLGSDQFYEDQRFWKKAFDQYKSEEAIEERNIKSHRKSFPLSKTALGQIEKVCERYHISKNVLFTAVYLLREYLVNGKTDIVVGLPVLGRNGKKEKNIVGMAVSAIPLRFILNGNKSIDEFMKELCQEIWECYKHQRYPLTDLMNDIRNESNAALDIYTTCINYYGTNMDTFLNSIMIENIEFFNGEQEYHLQIIIREWERCSVQLDFDYQTAYCSKEDINMMFDEMMNCINELSGKTGIVNNLSLLSKRDCRMLQEFNHTSREFAQNKTVLDLFLFQVEKNANKIAIEYGNNTYTYEQVMRLVCYYEGCYKKITDIKNKIVVVMLPHSIEAVASILAVMKLGGIFLTIDKTLPFRRMQYIINDAEPDLIITDDPIEFETNAKIYNVNKLRREQLSNVCMNNENCGDINGLAYIIYTSGSTGKPKGTLITQKGLYNYISWAIHEYIDDQPVSMPLFSSLSFDLTITSLFLPIMSGQRMIIYPGEDENEYVLNQIARENKCTIIKLTPAHLSILYAQLKKDSRLRKIIVGGENFQSELAKNVFDKLNQRVEIINEYGPTETVVGCSIHKYNPKDCGICVPIGRPIANTRIYILNKQMSIVPPGERGEIYIDGIQVARGYLHQEQLRNCK